MLTAIVRFSVRHASLVILFAVVGFVYACAQVAETGIDIFPEFSPRVVVIQTEALGLTAEQVEVIVTTPIERRLTGLVGLSYTQSESIQGLSVVTAVFHDGTDDYTNRSQVSERLGSIAAELPASVDKPVVVPLALSSATVRTIGVTSHKLNLMELRDVVEFSLVPRILGVPGVADVNIFGGEQRALQIVPDYDMLVFHEVRPEDVRSAARRITQNYGTGFLESENQQVAISVGNHSVEISQIAAAVVKESPLGVVRLGDVAKIKWGAVPRISAAQIMGDAGIVLMVIGQFGSDTLSISNGLESVLNDREEPLKARGISLHSELFVPARYVERSIKDLASHLLIGGIMVIAVLIIGLFSVRAAIISAVAIPLSLCAALLILVQFGVKLNIMILGGLAIALGEVVDDAIIDTENIFRRLRLNFRVPASQRRSTTEVVEQASLEVRNSVVFATMIVVIAFIPLLTLTGVAGRLFAPLAVTYILAVLGSLLIALTVTPALCRVLLRVAPNSEAQTPVFAKIGPGLEQSIVRMIDRPVTSVGICMLCLVLLIGSLPLLGSRFLPELREGHFIIHTASLPGTSLEESIRIGSRITDELLSLPGVRSVSQWAGRAERGADTYGSHYSEYEVALEVMSGSEEQDVLEQIRARLRFFPGVEVEANTFLTERIGETISGYSAPVVVNLFGPNFAELDRVAFRVSEIASSIEGSANVRIRSTHGRPNLIVETDPLIASEFGVTEAEINDLVQVTYAGKKVGRIIHQDRLVPVFVTGNEEDQKSPDNFEELSVLTDEGRPISLSAVSNVRLEEGRYNILHRNAQRSQVVTMTVSDRDLGGFVSELRRRVLTEVDLPPAVIPEFTGAAFEQARARSQLIRHSFFAGAVVVLILLLAVERLENVAIILANVPFSLLGGAIAALMTGAVLSIGSIVGFVTLFGITVRNTIMLVSHYQHLTRVEGLPWSKETAVRGVIERAPSIIMTALVTALAMLPLTINSDNPGREIMGPMASVIIGGLVTSTILNILVMPSLFYRFGRFGDHLKGNKYVKTPA